MARRRSLVAAALLGRLALLLNAVVLAGPGCGKQVASGRADGAAIFAEVCARCHGPVGVPDAANVVRLGVKPLTSPHVQRELSDEDIRRQILHGSRNKQMPAFAGALSEDQVDAIVGHVRTLSAGARGAAARTTGRR